MHVLRLHWCGISCPRPFVVGIVFFWALLWAVSDTPGKFFDNKSLGDHLAGGMFQPGDSYGGEGLHRLPANGKYTHLCIFLHGLGDTGNGWRSAFDFLLRNSSVLRDRLKVVLPTAAQRAVTMNYGMRMPAWFNLRSLRMEVEDDVPGYEESRVRIEGMLAAEEEKGVEPRRMIVGGFSQGGALSYYVAMKRLAARKLLGGLLVCSGWLPFHAKILPEIPKDQPRDTAILHCHGLDDQIVLSTYGSDSVRALRDNGFAPEFKEYLGMDHSTCQKEMEDMQQFLTDQVEKGA